MTVRVTGIVQPTSALRINERLVKGAEWEADIAALGGDFSELTGPIAGHDRHPVDSAIVSACADYIQTQRPVGADVTVQSAKAVQVSVSARVVLEGGASLAEVKRSFTDKLDAYLADLAFEAFTVYVTRVGALLLSIDGVVDYDGLTLNGTEGNLDLDNDGVPVLGEVSLT